jgi:hypothetical protein
MKLLPVILYILQFLLTALPGLIKFIQEAVRTAKEFIDGLKQAGEDEEKIEQAKAEARETIVKEAVAKYGVPETIARMAVEAEVYRQKGKEKEGELQVELAKRTYPKLFGEGE